ncbi:uncharacterized protein LOC114196037 isoform X5 [Vigna unguiculata]|uniref:uncharacterized protein LOC114196037 isoform X5 n=1 Tax=Vigna unguiculata TaxID=3917 RepID=UPI001016D6D9|nr:uncharacterized protein LOC114196037 isoform X5 [Vigna unguiculata]
METVMEDEEYNYREVKLPSLLPVAPEPELERETGERRRGRDIIIAIDHGLNSKHAFDWALVHFYLKMNDYYEISQGLMEKLAVEAFQVAMVKTVARIVEGDPGKIICQEAERIKPAAVILGTRGRGFLQREVLGCTACTTVKQHLL